MKLCTICARGGSKGVPGKNIRPLLGKPLIAYTIEQARASGLFEVIAVSSDSTEILMVAKQYGADITIQRPDELASDTAGKVPAIVHAILESEKISGKTFDVAVDLDATSPLRNVEDIMAATAMLETTGATSVITATPARYSPYVDLVEADERGIVSLSKPSCELESPACYDMNASIYVWNRDKFINNPAVFYDDTLLYVMPPERSLDIDHAFDFEVVEMLMNRKTAA